MRERAVQLQGILLPDAAVCGVEELYYHKNGNRTDFNGYFNLFYIEKRKRYTDIHNLYLDIRLQGYSSLVLVHDGKDIGKVGLDAPELREYRIQFPYGKYKDGCFWFALVGEEAVCREGARRTVPADANRPPKGSAAGTGQAEDKPARVVSGFYITEPSPDRVREVRIGAVICTYRREAYVERNLRQMKERVLGRAELDVSSRVKLYIIDNGRTLDRNEAVRELAADCGGRVVILPNRNAGGAGGFTRGMIEVLKAKEREGFTHVLLMDDDAVFEPDAFVRIHGLAATLKEKWKDITVGGAMLREEVPYILHCAGETWSGGWITAPEKDLDLRGYANASCRYLTGTDMERRMYSGWWCCCFSTGTVREDNLPLPLFIHHDDIEYGLRSRDKGIVFLNGVSVWHAGADTRFRGANLYYDIRNNLIETALHQGNRQTLTAAKILLRASASAMVRMKYRDMDLVYRGFTDFMRGPGWLLRQDPEELDREIRELSCRMVPLEDVRGQLTEEEYRDVLEQVREKQGAQGRPFQKLGGPGVWEDEGSRTGRLAGGKVPPRLVRWLTLYGWLLPADRRIKVITPPDPSVEVFRRGKLVMYEPVSGKAAVTGKKYRELSRGLALYLKMTAGLRYFQTAADAYRKGLERMTDRKTWKEYLKI